MPYPFEAGINPEEPLDPKDPPPPCWRETYDAHEHRKALFGHASAGTRACHEWELRELRRVKVNDVMRLTGIPHSDYGLVRPKVAAFSDAQLDAELARLRAREAEVEEWRRTRGPALQNPA